MLEIFPWNEINYTVLKYGFEIFLTIVRILNKKIVVVSLIHYEITKEIKGEIIYSIDNKSPSRLKIFYKMFPLKMIN